MFKTKFKFLICLIISVLLISSLSLATDGTTDENIALYDEIEAISDDGTTTDDYSDITRTGDVYVDNGKDYQLKDIIDGNAYISAKTFTMDPRSSGGIISGNLFVTANEVKLDSDTTYSATATDEEGNPSIESISSASVVYGNTFIVANKFIIEPGCEINGDLYITANEVEIAANAVIYGNVYIVANKMTLNGLIGGDLYVVAKEFTLTYNGFVNRDLHAKAENIILNGVLYRGASIEATKLVTKPDFICHGNFEANTSTFILLGDFKGDVKVESKNFYLITEDSISDYKDIIEKTETLSTLKEEGVSFTTSIAGKLDYKSAKEISDNTVVTGEITYSKYSSASIIMKEVLENLIGLCAVLIYLLVIFLVVSKFAPKCAEKCASLDFKNLLISLGVGIGLLIAVPLLFVLLCLIRVGAILGLLLLAIYALLLAFSIPTIIIMISEFLKSKTNNKLNSYLSIVIVTVVLWLLMFIPYVNAIITIIFALTGSGKLALAPFKKKENKD